MLRPAKTEETNSNHQNINVKAEKSREGMIKTRA